MTDKIQQQIKTQHCECGSEEYHIKWSMTETWAECASCGRPTSVFGDGREKQLQWIRGNHD